MNEISNPNFIRPIDERRDLIVPGNTEETIAFCIKHFIILANLAIAAHGSFSVALSGGSTPKRIFEGLSSKEYRSQIDWQKVKLFWGDERAVPPDHPDSNYHMAMEAGLKDLPILKENIFRMQAEENIDENALAYEKFLQESTFHEALDLVMLGMGDDGHTASLFPNTHGLHTQNRTVIANYVPQKDVWRMTLTFKAINDSQAIAIYVLGSSKAKKLKEALSLPSDPDRIPIQKVGTPKHRALWIADAEAASEMSC